MERSQILINALKLLSNNLVASISGDGMLKFWDWQSEWNCVHDWEGHNDCANCLIELANGDLCSGDDDKTILLWGMPTQKYLNLFPPESS